MPDALTAFIVAPYGIDGVANSTVEECIAYLLPKPVYTLDTETGPNIAWRNHPKAGLTQSDRWINYIDNSNIRTNFVLFVSL